MGSPSTTEEYQRRELERRLARRAAELADAKERLQREITRRVEAEKKLRRVSRRPEKRDALDERIRYAEVTSSMCAALATGDSLATMLPPCTQVLVEYLDACAAQIWILNEAANVLDLQASAGTRPPWDGPQGRVPVGRGHVGMVAARREPVVINAITGDRGSETEAWIRRENVVAFAGYPLTVGDKLVGVVGLFAGRPLSETALDSLASLASQIALGVDRRLAEESLRESEARLQQMADTIEDVFWITDWASHSVLFASRAYESVWGRSRQSLYEDPKAWAEAIHPDDRQRAWDHFVRLGEGANYDEDYRIIRPDGSVRWVRDRGYPIRDSNDEVYRVAGVAQDITELRRSQAELHKEKDFSTTLVQTSPAFFVAVSAGGKTMMMNDAMLSAVGYRRDEVVGRDYVSMFVPEADRAEVTEVFHKLTHTAEPTVGLNRVLTSDGAERLVEWHGRQVLGPEGGLDFFFGVGIDITERKQAEQERKHLEEQLHQSQKMEAIGQLAGGVAHDFNNLLTVIVGNVELLRRLLPDDEDIQQMLGAIDQASDQAVGLTRSLLTFSHNLPVVKRNVNLHNVVSDARELLSHLLPSNIEILAPGECDSPLLVHADSTQLQQVLINLAVNARDAMPGGGRLQISLSEAAGESDGNSVGVAEPELPGIRLEVSDTGTGIPPEFLDRVFEPFFTTKARGQGTGLGLAIVHGIVKDHDGRIEVRSQVDVGTAFTISFPAAAADTSPEAEDAAVAGPAAGHGELVLLAEDNHHVRGLISTSLKSLNYDVLAVEDGASLMDLVGQHGERAGLLVVDVDLPKRNGLDCLNDIRGAGILVPAIVITARVDKDIEDRLDGRAMLLSKPFQLSELGALAGRLIGEAAMGGQG